MRRSISSQNHHHSSLDDTVESRVPTAAQQCRLGCASRSLQPPWQRPSAQLTIGKWVRVRRRLYAVTTLNPASILSASRSKLRRATSQTAHSHPAWTSKPWRSRNHLNGPLPLLRTLLRRYPLFPHTTAMHIYNLEYKIRYYRQHPALRDLALRLHNLPHGLHPLGSAA